MLSLTLGKLQFLSVPGALLLFLTVIFSGGGNLFAQETIETLPPSPSDSFSNYELAPGDRIKVESLDLQVQGLEDSEYTTCVRGALEGLELYAADGQDDVEKHTMSFPFSVP